MKTIILTIAAVSVLGLISCEKEVIEPVIVTVVEPISDIALIQGNWSNNTFSINDSTSIGEPLDYPNANIEGNTWSFTGFPSREFNIVDDVITWEGAGSSNVISLTSCQIILTDTLDNGNVQVIEMNR